MSGAEFQIQVATSCARMAVSSALQLGVLMSASVGAFVGGGMFNEPLLLTAGVVGALGAAWNFTATFSYLKQHRAALAKLGAASP